MFKNIITTYLKGVISEISLDNIIRDEIKSSLKNIIINSDITTKVNEEVDRYIGNKISDESIKSVVYKTVGYYLKWAIENKKTFSEIGEISDKTIKEIIDMEITGN